MMYGIPEQYVDDVSSSIYIVTYHFLNVLSDLIYDKCHSFYRRATNLLFYICPDYC